MLPAVTHHWKIKALDPIWMNVSKQRFMLLHFYFFGIKKINLIRQLILQDLISFIDNMDRVIIVTASRCSVYG